MNLRNKLIIVAILFIASGLFLTNPSEDTYLSRVSRDYQKYHMEMNIPVEALKQVGKSERSTYLLFSAYEYQFGGVKVHYIGIANSIYYTGIQRIKKSSQPFKVV